MKPRPRFLLTHWARIRGLRAVIILTAEIEAWLLEHGARLPGAKMVDKPTTKFSQGDLVVLKQARAPFAAGERLFVAEVGRRTGSSGVFYRLVDPTNSARSGWVGEIDLDPPMALIIKL